MSMLYRSVFCLAECMEQFFVKFCQHEVLLSQSGWLEQIYLRTSSSTDTAKGSARDKTFFIFFLLIEHPILEYKHI